MRSSRILGLALVLALWPAIASAVKTGDPTTDEALPKLVCICGGCPKLALDHCTCGRAEELANEALALSREGNDSEQIVAAFVDRYGPQILAAPPARGFDLALWLGPLAALLIGAVILSIFLVRRRARGGEPLSPEAGTHPERLAGFDPFG